eukprot:TRINITY_DN83005_c0_g1_i1.p1 TRINITY_DN83005_c0_g1~~TRINITY_DN83005_c0_g1_i1.p1  ORF type:complete len:514 (-),score=139.98 TRINITY_DN83005_c0_g1_i1:12-1475(-)
MASFFRRRHRGLSGSQSALAALLFCASDLRGVHAQDLGAVRKLIRTESGFVDSTGRFKSQLTAHGAGAVGDVRSHRADALLDENAASANATQSLLGESMEDALKGTTVLLTPPSLASMSGRWWQNNDTNESTGSLTDTLGYTKPPEFEKNHSLPPWEAYPEFSLKASQDDELFANFRQTFAKRMYANIEGPQYDSGYVKDVVRKMRDTGMHAVDERVEQVGLAVDSIGNATVFPIDEKRGDKAMPNISGSSVRYLKFAYDMEQLFGDLGGFNIVEIGGGYGGQAAVLLSLFPNISSYTLVDLPEALHMANKFVRRAAKPHNSASPDDRSWRLKFIKGERGFRPEQHYDLLISSNAYSEVPLALREEYFNKLVRRSDRGFVVDNSGTTKKQFGDITAGALPMQLLMSGMLDGGDLLVFPTALPKADDGANIVAWNVTRDYFGSIVNSESSQPELWRDYPVRKLRRDCNLKFHGRDMLVCDEKLRAQKK